MARQRLRLGGSVRGNTGQHGFKVRLKGGQKLRQNLMKVARKTPRVVASAMVVEQNIEMTEMKERTPVDTTALRTSGHVPSPKFEGHNIIVETVFGGTGIDYAFIVHEDPDAIHPVGQWKYMESVQRESAPHMLTRLARRIDVRRLV